MGPFLPDPDWYEKNWYSERPTKAPWHLASVLASAAFTIGAGGWSATNTYPRELGEVNGDGRADIVGVGQDHVFVALGTSDGGFEPGLTASDEFTNAAGPATTR